MMRRRQRQGAEMISSGIPIYIGVGSNIAPEENIPRALEMMRKVVVVHAVSIFYRTAPIDLPDQSAYLNGVWRIQTDLPPRELKFTILRTIEDRLGRMRTCDKYAARTIDLDVLLYGDLVVQDLDCRIPDPDICQRAFLQASLLDLVPDLILPDMKQPLSMLVRAEEMATLEPATTFTAMLRSRLRPSAR